MKKEKKTDRISTFIGADASIDGAIDFKGTIRVDGKVKGKIASNGGTVVVGEKAVVDAEAVLALAATSVATRNRISSRRTRPSTSSRSFCERSPLIHSALNPAR